MDEIVREFLAETREHLDQLDQELIALEREPASADRLASIFRVLHSIKGSAGFLGFEVVGAVAHAGEDLLSRLRDGSLTLDLEIVSGLLSVCDALRAIASKIEQGGPDGQPGDYQDLVSGLKRLCDGAKPPGPLEPGDFFDNSEAPTLGPEPGPTIDPQVPVIDETIAIEPSRSPTTLGSEPKPDPLISPETRSPEPDRKQSARKPAKRRVKKADLVKPDAKTRPSDDPTLDLPSSGDFEATVEPQAEKPSLLAEPVVKEPVVRARKPGSSMVPTLDSTIRVDVAVLDGLMNLVGELVLARNQLVQSPATREEPSVRSACQRLDAITSELQEQVMKTRMQPIRALWGSVPRLVRDLAVVCGKQVRVEMEGEQTELDKTVLEAMKEPTAHIVRNAVDHGIEPPEKREARGKPIEGVIRLRAYHEGGQVQVEIIDDGGGIDPTRLRRKARERGLLPADQAARLTDREALDLIFLPGFSTSNEVTLVSGRGVGMDAVRTGVEAVGGAVELESWPGIGTRIKMRMPLTLMIVKALIVSAAGHRYAIPQVNLVEVARLRGDALKTVESLQDARVIRHRGALLPLVDLSRVLGWADRDAEIRPDSVVEVVAIQADGHVFGLVVDRIEDTQEIVVRPLARPLKSIQALAGGTVMGDGQVALILDAYGLARQAGVVAGTWNRRSGEPAIEKLADTSSEPDPQGRSLLVVEALDGARMAVPLDSVVRLEHMKCSLVERAGP
ncbi:MAG TPA: chemotaxis protein CheA, partial [Isosphaeraceae bacterium]|nr:chemotaxis protein CheA [Isosphaeraceae bacterium]